MLLNISSPFINSFLRFFWPGRGLYMDRVTALLTWCETSILNALKIKNFITSVFKKKSINRKVIVQDCCFSFRLWTWISLAGRVAMSCLFRGRCSKCSQICGYWLPVGFQRWLWFFKEICWLLSTLVFWVSEIDFHPLSTCLCCFT